MMVCGQGMSSDAEEILDESVHRQHRRAWPRGIEPSHLTNCRSTERALVPQEVVQKLGKMLQDLEPRAVPWPHVFVLERPCVFVRDVHGAEPNIERGIDVRARAIPYHPALLAHDRMPLHEGFRRLR